MQGLNKSENLLLLRENGEINNSLTGMLILIQHRRRKRPRIFIRTKRSTLLNSKHIRPNPSISSPISKRNRPRRLLQRRQRRRLEHNIHPPPKYNSDNRLPAPSFILSRRKLHRKPNYAIQCLRFNRVRIK